MSTAPYPHVEIGVRDDSIYTPIETENLPLNKPLYMMRAQKGPIGVPVWCPTYTYATRQFGEDTFNKRSVYFSEQAYFLLKTFPSNGAFIMRVADSTANSAIVSLELGVSKSLVDVPLWKRDANGRFVLELNGDKIPIKNNGEECQPIEGQTPVAVYAVAPETVAIASSTVPGTTQQDRYYIRSGNYIYTDVVPNTRRYSDQSYWKGVDRPTFTLVGADEEFVAGNLYFEYDSTGATATPKFNLTEFESGKSYLKFTGFESGYTLKPETELPEIATGQTIGDKFTTISETAIAITAPTGEETVYYGATTSSTIYVTYVFTRALDSSNPYTYTHQTIPVGTSLLDRTYYYLVGMYDPGVLEPQGTIKGYKIAWRAHVRSNYTTKPVGSSDSEDSTNFTWYPMLDLVAENCGIWGNKFGVKLFFDSAKNTVSGTLSNSAMTVSFAPVQLVGDDTTPTAITDAYGETITTGVVRKGAYDSTTDVELSLDKRVPGNYFDTYALPIQVTWIYSNWDLVGRKLMKAEIASDTTAGDRREVIHTAYPDFRTILDASGDAVAETFVDALFEKYATDADCNTEDAGYMANVLSCVDAEKIPFFCSCVVDSTDTLITTDTLLGDNPGIVVPSAETAIYLKGGTDGNIGDSYIEKYIQGQITATIGQTQEYLVDYARCPFNAIYDTGVSLTTKKAYLDLLSARDSLVVNLTCQQVWLNADGTRPAVNLRADDESIGSNLRAYAWLMREDVANGTEACRAKIFLHAGYTSDSDHAVSSALWVAIKDAQYYCRSYIYKEAKELPNAAVECYTKLSWVAYAEDTKSRCWNAGLNYVQYYNMKSLHYASVRTVYRYETSILVDAGVVNALCFMKDEVRRSWATFAGSTRPAAELNKKIMEDLSSRFSALLHGKYNYAVSVYQTDEDVKLGYVRHVDIQLISPATNRVWLATIICKREGYEPEE